MAPLLWTSPGDLAQTARRLMVITHYDLLGLPATASHNAVVAAGVALGGAVDALAATSDPGHVTAVRQALEAAVTVLTDVTRRALYDRFLADRKGRRRSTRSDKPSRAADGGTPLPELSFTPVPSPVPEVPRPPRNPTGMEIPGTSAVSPSEPPEIAFGPPVDAPPVGPPIGASPRPDADAAGLVPRSPRTTRSMRRPSQDAPPRESARPSARSRRPSAAPAFDAGTDAAVLSTMRKDLTVLSTALELCIADLAERGGPRTPRFLRALRTLANVRARHAVAQAQTEERSGHWSAAAAWWLRAIAARPDDGRHHLGAATTLVRAGGDLDTADQCARKAIELGPDADLARAVLAEITARRAGRPP